MTDTSNNKGSTDELNGKKVVFINDYITNFSEELLELSMIDHLPSRAKFTKREMGIWHIFFKTRALKTVQINRFLEQVGLGAHSPFVKIMVSVHDSCILVNIFVDNFRVMGVDLADYHTGIYSKEI